MPANLLNLTKIGSIVSITDHKIRLHIRVVVLGAPKVGKTAIIQQFLYSEFPQVYNATVDEMYRTQYEIRGLGTLILDILDTSGSHEFPAMRKLAIESGDAFLLVFSLTDPSSFEEVRYLRDLIIQIKKNSGKFNNKFNREEKPNICDDICKIDENNMKYNQDLQRKNSRFKENGNDNNSNSRNRNNNYYHNISSDNSKNKNNNGITTPPIVVTGNKSDLDSMRMIRKEVAETIINIDWENGYVESSAKKDDNISTIFQELLIQAKVPYDIGSVFENQKSRRRSLPAYPTSPKVKDRIIPKRNSCAVS